MQPLWSSGADKSTLSQVCIPVSVEISSRWPEVPELISILLCPSHFLQLMEVYSNWVNLSLQVQRLVERSRGRKIDLIRPLRFCYSIDMLCRTFTRCQCQMHATGNSVEVFGAGGWRSEMEQMLLHTFRSIKGAHLFSIEDVDCIVVQRRLTKGNCNMNVFAGTWWIHDLHMATLPSRTGKRLLVVILHQQLKIQSISVRNDLKVKLLICRGRLGHENALFCNSGVWCENFRVVKWRIFGDFLVSDVLVLPLLATWSRLEWQVCCRRRSANTWRSCCGGSLVPCVCWIATRRFAEQRSGSISGGCAQLRTEDAYRMLSIVNLDAIHSLFRVRRDAAQVVALSRPVPSVFNAGHRYFCVWLWCVFFKTA